MADNQFIARRGIISLDDSQITGSLSVTNSVTASFFTGSFKGDGSQLSGVSAGFPFTGSATISGSLQVTGSISTDTDATINSLTVGKGGGNLENNTVLGYEAFISNVEGEGNVAIGYKALSSSLAGMGPNTAVGNQALGSNVYGFRNTAVGNAVLFSNTSGIFNTAVGNTALVSNTGGSYNNAVGDGALSENIGGDSNIAIGHDALHDNTEGDNNVSIGNSSLYNNITGSNNTAIGTDAGQYAGASITSLTSVNNSIFIGYQSRALNAVGDTNEIVIGYNVVGSGSNTTVIGNNSTVSTTLKGAVSASIFSGSFRGDGSQLTGIADPTPITATINNTNSPFTITSQSIVIIDSTNGDVTVNLPDLDLIDGTPDQKPILLYKNDYSQNVIYVEPSGSQLVNGTTQDIIVSIQIAIAYNPTSAGWVTEGTSYQSLAELELFFVPRTETGSFATTGSNQFSGSQAITGSLTVTGNITGNITGSASTASYVEYANVANKPAIVSGSSQITYSGLTGIPSGILSGSAQIASFGIFATTGSNQFNGNQSITGSLTVSGQVVAQTLNVQQVTSSIVYSSGSNIFGNSVSNVQQFTGSLQVSGSTHYLLGSVGIGPTGTPSAELQVGKSSDVTIAMSNSSSVTSGARGSIAWYNSSVSSVATIRAAAVTDNVGTELQFFTRPAAGSLTQAMTLNASGNLSIGNTNDTYKLEVHGEARFYQPATSTTAYLRVENNRSRNAALNLKTTIGDFLLGVGVGTDTNQFQIYDNTAGANRLVISSTGAVTFITNSNSTISNTFQNTDTTNASTRNYFNIVAGTNRISLYSLHSDNNYINTAYGDLYFQMNASTSTTNPMIIKSSGNVGIGNPSPGDKLVVNGNIGATDGSFASGESYSVYLGDKNAFMNSTFGEKVNFGAYNGFTFGFSQNGNLTLSSTWMTISSDGKIQINNQVDTAQLSSYTSANNWNIYARSTASSGPVYGFLCEFGNQSPNNTTSYFYYGGDTVGARFSVRANGGIYNYQANNQDLSDERVKKDIEPLESYWDKFKALEIVKFKYKDQTHDDFNIGVIAQQVESVAPEFVDVDGWDTKPKLDEEGNEIVSTEEPLKSIYTADLHHATIKVLQECMSKIEEQQSQIEILKAEIQTLKQ